ncbi:MAG: HlyD family secretion protein [Hyphomicrobiaceae bacterium]|jgi:HlyD family secretion protein
MALRPDIDEGREVARDEVLAMVTPAPEDPRLEASIRAELAVARARVREAAAQVAAAQSADDHARGEAERRKALFAQGLISQETHEVFLQTARSARAGLDAANASLRAAESEVARAQSRLLGNEAPSADGKLAALAVVAPVSGTVLRVFEDSERVVTAGTPLFEIVEGSELEIVVELLTEDAVLVSSGDAVRISGWGGQGLLPAALDSKRWNSVTGVWIEPKCNQVWKTGTP